MTGHKSPFSTAIVVIPFQILISKDLFLIQINDKSWTSSKDFVQGLPQEESAFFSPLEIQEPSSYFPINNGILLNFLCVTKSNQFLGFFRLQI